VRNIFVKFFEPLEQLNKRIYRLLIALSFLLPIAVGFLTGNLHDKTFFVLIFLYYIYYWLIVRIVYGFIRIIKKVKMNKQ
jgi:hypothetical protein